MNEWAPKPLTLDPGHLEFGVEAGAARFPEAALRSGSFGDTPRAKTIATHWAERRRVRIERTSRRHKRDWLERPSLGLFLTDAS